MRALRSKKHPGEDYNCRCWAEPYIPPKQEEMQGENRSADTEEYMSFGDKALAAMSGIFGISEAKAKEPEIDAVTSASRHAINNLLENRRNIKKIPPVPTRKPEYSFEKDPDYELITLMGKNLIKTENMKNYIYLDKYRHITSGVGALLDDEKVFKSIPWQIGDRLATKEEVDEAYRLFVNMQNEKDSKGEFKYKNYKAEFFKDKSPLRISEKFMIDRMRTHIKENLSRVRSKMKDFDDMPEPMKLIILDFYYNKGSFYNQPGLPQALKDRDIDAFIEKMQRTLDDRNKWTLEQLKKVPKVFWLK